MMIGWGDVYKVVEGMVPLCVALILGYASVKWCRMFTSEHCNTINTFNCYFVMPFFTFKFVYGINPYHMNFRFLAGDVLAKAIVCVVIALWAIFSNRGSFDWAITSFALSSFNNTLVVGVPLLRAMHGSVGEDLVVQSSVVQFLLWFPILLFMLEYRRACFVNKSNTTVIDHDHQLQPQHCSIEIVRGTDHSDPNNGSTSTLTEEISTIMSSPNQSFPSTVKKVCAKLAKNLNAYACVIGLIWALLARRWDFEMPKIVDGSIQIMGKAGSGVAMFSIGQFMALQERLIACGFRLTLYGMVMRFVCGPLATAVGCVALGLRSHVLRIAIIQAALPQAVACFVYAQEYSLHAHVLSTMVIFGTIISLPLLILYNLGLDVLH